METGQLFMMQMPTMATNPVAMASPAPAQTMSAEGLSGSDFAALLQSVAPVVSLAGQTATATEGEAAVTQQVQTKETTEESAARLPHEAALDAAGAQLAQALQISGRMPETMPESEKQVVEASARLVETVAVQEAPFVQVAQLSQAAAQAISKAPVMTSAKEAPSGSAFTEVKTEISATTPATRIVAAEQPEMATVEKELSRHIEAEHVAVKPSPASVELEQPETEIENQGSLSYPAHKTSASAQQAAGGVSMSQQAPLQQIMEAYSRPVATKPAPGIAEAVLQATQQHQTAQATAVPAPPIKEPSSTAPQQMAVEFRQFETTASPQAVQHPVETVAAEQAPAATQVTATAVSAPPVKAQSSPATQQMAVETVASNSTPVIASPEQQSVARPASPQAVQQATTEAQVTATAVFAPPVEEQSSPATQQMAVEFKHVETVTINSTPVIAAPAVSASLEVETAPAAQPQVVASTEPATTVARGTTRTQQAPLQQIMEAYSRPVVSKPLSAIEIAATPEPVPTADATPIIKRVVETASVPVHLAAKENEPQTREERTLQQSASVTSAKITASNESLLSAAVKETSSIAQEDASTKENPFFDQKMTGHLQHVTAPQAGSTAVPAVSASSEQTQPTALAEHVGKQVGERIAAHEIKSGSEQIVLRLSPENLGELKVNLKMENQRLTVEIVTENKAVTDALRQNSDSLKETLAKQNIKMDSFDVSTGSNNQDNLAGKNSRNMGEWQEMARNRQANQWTQGGYSIPVAAVADNATVQASYRRQGLVDVHY